MGEKPPPNVSWYVEQQVEVVALDMSHFAPLGFSLRERRQGELERASLFLSFWRRGGVRARLLSELFFLSLVRVERRDSAWRFLPIQGERGDERRAGPLKAINK